MDLVHGDVAQRVVIPSSELDWEPMRDGMSLKVLDCTATEPLITTTLIRLEPGSQLAEQRLVVAEDIFCLSGGWADHAGEYGSASFVHSPAGSVHAPRSDGGVLLLSKACGGLDASARVVIDTTQTAWHPAQRPGIQIMMLREHGSVRVALLHLPPGARIDGHDHPQGEEFFVLDGALEDEDGHYPQGTWVRQPPGSRHAVFAEAGCTLFSVAGHLA
jgi:anti-sigma factor ChrR (cupin superfamily)